jgi:hypothetical protein
MRDCTVHDEQSTIRAKVLLMQCFIAEGKCAKFLIECINKYGSTLAVEELLQLKSLTLRITDLLDQIEASDEKKQDNDSDDKVPLPVKEWVISSCYEW